MDIECDKREYEAHRARMQAIAEQFGIAAHKKRAYAEQLAYDSGYTEDYDEVESYFCGLARLLEGTE
jgi:hypothetical protein